MRRIALLLLLVLLAGVLLSSCDKVTKPQFNVDRSACNGCGNCTLVCPVDAIEIDGNDKAVIDQTLCIQDGLCVRACPQNAIY